MTFDEWWVKETGYDIGQIYEYDVAKRAWNAAMLEAEDSIGDAYGNDNADSALAHAQRICRNLTTK